VVGKHGDTLYASLFKDVAVKGTVEVRPDGTKVYAVDVVSDVQSQFLGQALQAAVSAAARVAAPLKP
jgi:uncharacterized Zn ribbon protein